MRSGWVSPLHLGLNQGPIVLMIENYRSDLLWRLMRQCPYLVSGLRRAGFSGGWLEALNGSAPSQCYAAAAAFQPHPTKRRHAAAMARSTAPSLRPNWMNLCINTIRFLAVDMVQKAKSGHPGLPLGFSGHGLRTLGSLPQVQPERSPLGPIGTASFSPPGMDAYALYALASRHRLRFAAASGTWRSSANGEAARLAIRNTARPLESRATTGPLGQGFANAVGMAIAEAALAAGFNRPGHQIVDHYTYVLASGGDLEEGISSEAGSMAGHLRLGKLIVLYANNHITIEGNTGIGLHGRPPGSFRRVRLGTSNELSRATTLTRSPTR